MIRHKFNVNELQDYGCGGIQEQAGVLRESEDKCISSIDLAWVNKYKKMSLYIL